MKPSEFSTKSTMGSIAKRHEPEVIAVNVMKILARNGDTFRLLSWEEYAAERQEDGNFTERERPYFDQVVNYCASSHGAAAFCPGWAEVAMALARPFQVGDLVVQKLNEDKAALYDTLGQVIGVNPEWVEVKLRSDVTRYGRFAHDGLREDGEARIELARADAQD